MNIYRGCEHRCIYCDSRSECYQITNFDELIIKANAIELLKQELGKKHKREIIGTGARSDPYTKSETNYKLTGQALQIIADYGFGIHITTKSDLILKDLDIIKKISAVKASVAFTLTTTNDDLARKIEPLAPLPSQRLAAIKILAKAGIHTGVTMMPLLPFIEDTAENITHIVTQSFQHGAKFIIPWFGMSLRDRQRDYYYVNLDRLFPGVRDQYEVSYGMQYMANSHHQKELNHLFQNLCASYGIITNMKAVNTPIPNPQYELF